MKLAIAGATGFVGRETLLAALRSDAIESVLVLGRRSVQLASVKGLSKLQEILVDDFESYNDGAKAALRDVDAFIWTIALTPSKSKPIAWSEVEKICHEYPLVAFSEALGARTAAKPLLFVYYSGHGAERDPSKEPPWEPQYCLLRGRTEATLLERATNSNGKAQVCCLKPGRILEAGAPRQPPIDVGNGATIPSIAVDTCVAASVKQCLQGIEADTLSNDNLERIGQNYMLQGKL